MGTVLSSSGEYSSYQQQLEEQPSSPSGSASPPTSSGLHERSDSLQHIARVAKMCPIDEEIIKSRQRVLTDDVVSPIQPRTNHKIQDLTMNNISHKRNKHKQRADNNNNTNTSTNNNNNDNDPNQHIQEEKQT